MFITKSSSVASALECQRPSQTLLRVTEDASVLPKIAHSICLYKVTTTPASALNLAAVIMFKASKFYLASASFQSTSVP